MHRSSKYAALALLISTTGPAALLAADGMAPQETSVTFKKPSREAERRARVVSQRMKVLLECAKRA